MKTLEMTAAGFNELGISVFIATIESVLPHTPGNWEFIGIDEKLNFISKNKDRISEYIKSEMVSIPISLLPYEVFELTESEREKYNAGMLRYKTLQSASVAIY